MRTTVSAVLLTLALGIAGLMVAPAGALAASEHDGKAPVIAGPSFVKLPSMIIPVVYANRAVQFVELQLSIEVPDSAVAEEYQAKMKYLQDRVLSKLHGRFDETIGVNGGRIDTMGVKRTVASAVAGVMGRETVKDVLIEQIRQRPI